MASQLVPVTNAPNQSFAVSLNVDSRVLVVQLSVRFSEIAGYWVLTIRDRSGNALVDSVPMITGAYPAANLLQQHRYLGIGSLFLVNASGVSSGWPDATNLGSDFVLLWSDSPTV